MPKAAAKKSVAAARRRTRALAGNAAGKTNTWNTPPEIVRDVVACLGGVELDPCSDSASSPSVPAKRHFTQSMDGLSKEWKARTVFMNHPYDKSKRWVPHAAEQYEKGHTKEAILLIRLDTSVRWWQSVAKYPFVAVKRKIAYLKNGVAGSPAPFSSALVYLGPNLTNFRKHFSKYGPVYRAYK